MEKTDVALIQFQGRNSDEIGIDHHAQNEPVFTHSLNEVDLLPNDIDIQSQRYQETLSFTRAFTSH